MLMRTLLLADSLITTKELDALKAEFSSFVEQYTGIVPVFFKQFEDYSNVPTEKDGDGDLKPTKAYTTALMNKITATYGRYGVDNVVMLVHRDNWIYKGIWGTNWSNVYSQDHVQLCRFDNKNLANSMGTLYHEWMHSLDALIKTHTGFEIDTLFKDSPCFVDWDSSCIHANRFVGCKQTTFKYIQWKENTDALVKITPYLKQAFKARKELYLEPYKHVQLQVISYLRAFLNRKDGVKK